MPYSNLALDADRENGPAARSFPTGQARGLKAHADAHDGIMVRIKRSYRIQVCGTKMRPMASSPRIINGGTAQMPKLCKKPRRSSSSLRVLRPQALRNTSVARRQAAKLCYRFDPLTPSARPANLIAGDGTKNGFPAPNKEPPTNQNHYLTGKAPYKFESSFLQQRVHCKLARGLGSRC